MNKLVKALAVVFLISGMGNAVVSNADPSGVGIYPGPKLTAEEEKREMENIGMIVTKYGDFIRVQEEGNFDKSQITHSKNSIGPNTKELILDYGIFVKKD
ncbi:hypothetical protein [Paenibacillus sp. Y412MC10]|uniref:hypothetical protein n=1 Tax=Geobacillus sp. (strain Y412MC10) TaxID=481743 RepID=UPI0011AB6D83|nr:hypothetical protein [Paenibacillus sp. Y412MC10]